MVIKKRGCMIRQFLIFLLILNIFLNPVEASVNITGISIKGTTKYNRYSSYETSQGTLLEGFENITQWTVSGTGGSISQNTGSAWATVRESFNSISLITDQAGTTQMVKDLGSAVDLSTPINFTIWVNPLNQTALTNLNVYFSSVSDFSTNFKYNMPQANSTYNSMWPRWNRVLMPKNSFVNTGSESWSAIRYIKIEQITNAASTVNLDGLYYGYTLDKPKLILVFDDGLAGVINFAYPKMHANGQRGVAFINLSNIGAPGGMTQANLATLYADGWDISNHNGAPWDGLTNEQVISGINTGINTLTSWGYGDTAKFYAYPNGQWKYPAYDMIQELAKSSVFARGVNQVNVYQTLPVMNENDPYANQVFYLGAGNFLNGFSTTSAQVCGWFDTNIAAGGLYIMTFHDIKQGQIFTAFQWPDTKFNETSDCIKAKVDAGQLEVITFSDLYESYLR